MQNPKCLNLDWAFRDALGRLLQGDIEHVESITLRHDKNNKCVRARARITKVIYEEVGYGEPPTVDGFGPGTDELDRELDRKLESHLKRTK